MDVERKRQEERETVREIMKLYCHGHKHLREQGKELCPSCLELAAYADVRIGKCPRMEVKTFCSVCPIHCYAQPEQERIQEIMRYGGPRMLLHHPIMALRHMFIQWRTRHGLRKQEAIH